jgi:hypothetical protein
MFYIIFLCSLLYIIIYKNHGYLSLLFLLSILSILFTFSYNLYKILSFNVGSIKSPDYNLKIYVECYSVYLLNNIIPSNIYIGL